MVNLSNKDFERLDKAFEDAGCCTHDAGVQGFIAIIETWEEIRFEREQRIKRAKKVLGDSCDVERSLILSVCYPFGDLVDQS